MTVTTILWALLACFVLAQISSFCTTIYLHRTITHNGVKLHPIVGLLMHLELTLTTGLKPREWAAVHRKHHQFSDVEGDPHSPYLYGMWNVLFLNALMYRRELSNPETVRKYTPNWKPDLIDRIPYAGSFGPLLGMALMAVGCGDLFGHRLGLSFWTGAVLGVVCWFVQAVMYIFLNSMINSICHVTGYRTFDNKATNLQWVALLTAGEGLHNNHHEFPASARMDARRGEIDPAWPVIWVLAKLGLAEYREQNLARAA